MEINLSCADYTFPLLSHDKVLALIGLLDFQGVNIGLFEGRSHLWPSREFEDTARSARRLKQKANDHGLEVTEMFLQTAPEFVPYAINQPDAGRRRKARDWFLRTLEYAGECGCPHVTVLPGVNFPGEPRGESFGRSVEELAWRVDQARLQSAVVGVEAHVGSIAPRPRLARKLVESTPGLTLSMDYTHFTRAGIPDSNIEPLLKYASHFDVRGARRGRLQASFKENTIDYARALRSLRLAGYDGVIGIEYVWIDWEHANEVDNISETILFRDFLREEWRKITGPEAAARCDATPRA